MLEVKKVDTAAAGTAKEAQPATDPKEKEKRQKALLNAELQRQLTTDEGRQKAIVKATDDFMKYGVAGNKKIVNNRDEAQEMAENYINDRRYEENMYGTRVFIDKAAYDAAEKERDAQKDILIKQFTQQGMSKKEAKQKADAMLVENEYIPRRKKKTRAFIENNRDIFYDEAGNFSSTKFKAAAVKFANTHTQEGEYENHYLSLKERREVANDYDVNARVIKNIAKYSNIGYEKDLTNLYRALYVAGTTAAGAGLGAALGYAGFLNERVTDTVNMTQTIINNDHVIVKDEYGNIISETVDDGEPITQTKSDQVLHDNGLDTKRGAGWGAVLGLGVGLATMVFVKDKGGKEARVYEPGQQTEPVKITDKPVLVIPEERQDIKFEPVKPCILAPDQTQEEFCDYKVQKGEYWAGIVAAKYKREDGTGFNLDPAKRTKEENKEIMEIVHYLKDKHGIKYSDNMQPGVIRLYSNINGKTYKLDCDASVKEVTDKFDEKTAKRYKGKAADGTFKYFYVDCDGNRSKMFNSAEERDNALRIAQEEENRKALHQTLLQSTK